MEENTTSLTSESYDMSYKVPIYLYTIILVGNFPLSPRSSSTGGL